MQGIVLVPLVNLNRGVIYDIFGLLGGSCSRKRIRDSHFGEDLLQAIKRLYLVFLIVFFLSCCLYGFMSYQHFYHDDSYISLRYAHNLLQGQGLVWNSSERVEGYTNFLFVILASALAKLGLGLETASRCLGLFSYVALLGFLLFFSARLQKGDADIAYKFLPVLLTGTCFSLIAWAWGGMETVLYSLLLFVAVAKFSETRHTTLRSGVLVGMAFAAAALTRPEGVLSFLVSLLFLLFTAKDGKNSGYKYILGFGFSFFCAYAPFLLWRILYYGDIFPNTYYVKAGFHTGGLSQGLSYVAKFLFSPPYFGLLVLPALFYMMWKNRPERWEVYLWTLVGVHCVYVVYVGGDHMPAFRFMVPMVPVLSLVIFRSLNRARRYRAVVAGLVCCFVLFQVILPSEDLSRAKLRDQAAFVGEIIGRYISDNFPEGSMIALNTAGSTPFFAPRHGFIDMLGLNDRTIAKRKIVPEELTRQKFPGHAKGDGRYVLSRKPDYIIIGPAAGTDISHPWFLSDLEISQNKAFYTDYERRSAVIDVSSKPGFEEYRVTHTGKLVFTYYRRIIQRQP